MPWLLCSKQDVLSIHPTAESALQDFWSDAVEDMIRRHLGSPFLGAPMPVESELHSGNQSAIILVFKPNIVSVSKVTINRALIEPTEYVVFPNGIQFIHNIMPEGILNVSISYVSGGDVDPIVRLCAAAMIVAILQYRGRAGADGSIKWGKAQEKEGEPSPTFDAGLVDNLTKIMKKLLRRTHLRIR